MQMEPDALQPLACGSHFDSFEPLKLSDGGLLSNTSTSDLSDFSQGLDLVSPISTTRYPSFSSVSPSYFEMGQQNFNLSPACHAQSNQSPSYQVTTMQDFESTALPYSHTNPPE